MDDVTRLRGLEDGRAAGLEARVRKRLQDIDASGLRREPLEPSGIDVSSNDYLRLATHPLLADRMRDAVFAHGCGSTGSRLLRGHRAVFDDVERAFARFKGADRALYFSSGYLANLAVVTTFAERTDAIIADRLNHASLRDAVRLANAHAVTCPHNDPRALAGLIAQHAHRPHTFVVTESLFGMDGDMPPLAEYAAMCRQAGATLIVDEAHAVGIYGARGSGLLEHAGLSGNDAISINTAGKALGVAGAFVAGPSWAIDYLVQRARPFVFSTAPPPALAAALGASLEIIAAEPHRRQRLLDLARYLRRQLRHAGFDVADSDSPIVPVIVGDTDRTVAAAEQLRTLGFDVRAIRPPTVPVATDRLRLMVHVGLDEPLLDRLVAALTRALKDQACGHAVSS
jgi:8-amino-7-oxononanoate synthase